MNALKNTIKNLKQERENRVNFKYIPNVDETMIDKIRNGDLPNFFYLNYDLKTYSVNELTINEQNPQARGFYEHFGFEVYKRSELDEQGNPYPILYMKLK